MIKDRADELSGICRDIRRTVLEMVHAAGSGHMGGSLSCVEIVATLMLEKMRFDPKNPTNPDRDRFVLSKGHAAPTLYAVLGLLGLIEPADLLSLRKLGSPLQGHPDMKSVPGIEMSSGPLGLGLSVGIGMALAARLDGSDYHTFVLLGDGEVQEGIVWEAAMAASHYHLDRLIAVLDHNGVQLDGTCDDVMSLGDVAAKWAAFGWTVLECDGHSISDFAATVDRARQETGRPVIIMARTVKGKGVSFMEGRNTWHGKPVDSESYARAAEELGGVSIARG